MTRALTLGYLLLIGCANNLPEPQTARHPESAFILVPYPPPAALAEAVPARPAGADLVWLDGEWIFRGDAYVWRRGGWVRPPPQMGFAVWRTRYLHDGGLQLASGCWYGTSQQPLPLVEPIAPALTPPNERTSEFGVGR